LQGEDIFLESLPEPFRSAALQNLQKNSQKVDGFLLHSRYYADFMQQYLGLPPDKMRVVPLGIDLRDFTVAAVRSGVPRPFTIGYLARLAPEKGLHLLVDAFIHVHQKLGVHDAHLRVAGWLGEAQRSYAAAQFARLEQAGLSDHFQYVGEVDRAGKVAFLQEIDILSVPTTYREPKGLYVLEALAAGVPVVQPDHGAFPELLASTAGGVLVPPENAAALAAAWQALRNDPTRRRALGDAGRLAVQERHSAAHMAKSTLATIRSYLADLPGAMEEPLATS
jgi:glycosyltransferase involved in cell wall biosynthesis